MLPHSQENYLFRSPFRVRVANQLPSVQTQDNGIPQGPPLSLFLAAINEVFSAIEYPLKTILFTDDPSVHLQTNDCVRAHSLLQKTINIILWWLNKIGFRIVQRTTQLLSQKRSTISSLTSSPQNIGYPNKILGAWLLAALWLLHIRKIEAETYEHSMWSNFYPT